MDIGDIIEAWEAEIERLKAKIEMSGITIADQNKRIIALKAEMSEQITSKPKLIYDKELRTVLTEGVKKEIDRLRDALHDAEAIGDFPDELRDRLALKEAASCVPKLQEEVERLREDNANLRSQAEGLCDHCGEQLDEAFCVKCWSKEVNEAESLRTRMDAALELLRRIEWQQPYVMACLFCGREPEYGHKPDCRLAKALEGK